MEIWPSTDTCPGCGSQLAYESKGRPYSRCIGVEVQGVYDGVLYWMCPLCGHKWHRFPSGHHLTVVAERYIHEVGTLSDEKPVDKPNPWRHQPGDEEPG